MERLSERTAGSKEFGGSVTAILRTSAAAARLFWATAALAAVAVRSPSSTRPVPSRRRLRHGFERVTCIRTPLPAPEDRTQGADACMLAPRRPRTVHHHEQDVEYSVGQDEKQGPSAPLGRKLQR